MPIGHSVPRVDALPKVTGQARFLEDLIPSNAAYGAVLHSTIANGFVKHIDASRAKVCPGVLDVVTCFDVPDKKYPTAGHPLSLDPNHQDVKNRQMLSSRVRYYGEEIAVVVASTQSQARAALSCIDVGYDVYPPALTPQQAQDALPLHEESPQNESARMDFSIQNDKAQFEVASFENSVFIENEYKASLFHTAAVHACQLEINGCFVYLEGNRYNVVSTSQVPHTLRRNIAEALGISVGKVRVVKPVIGGGFGNKQDMLYEPLAAFLSKRLGGRCVAMLMSREECFLHSRTRHAMDIALSMKLDNAGKLTQNVVRIHSNGGAYAAHRHAVAAYAITNAFQTYVGANVQIGRSSTHYTNLPTASALRGYGIPQINFAVESHLDDLAKEKGMDPLKVRLTNCMPEGFVDPFDGYVPKSNGLLQCIRLGEKRCDWQSKRRAYDEFNMHSKELKKGLGMAVFSYKTGVYPLQIENGSCRILLNEDGSAQVQVGATELGQGSDTVFTQMVCEILDLPLERVHLVSNQDTDISPHDCGAYASRQSYVTGGAVKQSAELIKEKILSCAAQMLQCPKSELNLAKEQVFAKDKSVSLADIATFSLFQNDGYSNTTQLVAESTYTAHSTAVAFGASFVDLEVDVPFGEVHIKKIIAIHDSGRILNPQLAKGQVVGGVAMGVGYALGEQLIFDAETGRCRNNNLLDYKIPSIQDIPPIEVHFIETNETSGPFGNKALAEPPIIPQAPAIRNAILHATGVAMHELPMTQQTLILAFQRKGLLPTQEVAHHV